MSKSNGIKDLKQAAKLLNKHAPDGESLAYINPEEGRILKAHGGSGIETLSGVPSYAWWNPLDWNWTGDDGIIEKGKDWKLWVLCDRDPVTNWVDRKVAVLGDAAHPMLQYLAQGACMAIEDAVCLSEEVKNEKENIEQALINYQNKRMLRTARVQLHSREIGKHVYHADGVHALLRNQIMKSKI